MGGGGAKSCHLCGSMGHLKRDCPQSLGANGGAEGKSCHACGQFGHLKRDCPQGGGGGGGVMDKVGCRIPSEDDDVSLAVSSVSSHKTSYASIRVF